MANKEDLDKAYMACAYAMAELSSAVRRQVGAILVKEGIIGEGYNGTPSGFDNCCETKMTTCEHIDVFRCAVRQLYVCADCKEESTEPRFKRQYRLVTKPEVLHAESNAIAKVARSNNSSIGATMYTTLCPCVDCAKLIIQAGIVRVVYNEDYKSLDGPELLKKAGIQVDKLDG